MTFRAWRDVPQAQNCSVAIPTAVIWALSRCGPVALTFKGTVSYKEVDETNVRVIAEAIGNETRAHGTARANVVFTLLT